MSKTEWAIVFLWVVALVVATWETSKADDGVWVEQYTFGDGEWRDYLVYPDEGMYYELGSGEWVHVITDDKGILITTDEDSND